MHRRRLMSCVVAMTFAVTPVSGQADWIGEFYTAAGAGSNVTMPAAIASQSVVGYSGGGLTWRIPNKNFQPIQISPPSLKAGCNGIDAFLGSYSVVNMDRFVQALRNFGQAAVGYFFELALRTMAPEIAVTLDVINDLANKANALTMGNCAAAKAAVNKIAGPWFDGMKEDAVNRARKFGEEVDNFVGNENFKVDFGKVAAKNYEANFNKAEGAVTRADVKKFTPVKVNVLRWAIERADQANEMTDDEKDLLMSMVGPTLIFMDSTSTDEPGEQAPITAGRSDTIRMNDLIGNTNNRFEVLQCADAQCLNVVSKTDYLEPFRRRVEKAVQAIGDNIDKRVYNALSAEQQTILRLSSVPLARAVGLSKNAGVAGVVATSLTPSLVDLVAYDAAFRFVMVHLVSVERALQMIEHDIPGPALEAYKAMLKRIRGIKDDAQRTMTAFYQNNGEPYKVIDQLDKIERAMYGNLNAMLAANARFGKRH